MVCRHSYKGAQIFEAVGLGADVVECAFVGTASRVGGRSIANLGVDALEMHALGFPPRDIMTGACPNHA